MTQSNDIHQVREVTKVTIPNQFSVLAGLLKDVNNSDSCIDYTNESGIQLFPVLPDDFHIHHEGMIFCIDEIDAGNGIIIRIGRIKLQCG